MAHDQSERLSKLQQKLAQFEDERHHAIGEQREDLRSLKETLRLSLRVVALASAPSVVWVICWATVVAANESVFDQVLTACFSLGLLAVMSIAGARASGLAAYWWFNRTVVRLRLATIVLSLLVGATLFGWVVVIVHW
ncbi:hypothetical protein [Schlesneria paludicola]|uniref:hypothetical protein n=1 Tax=Schlesneria paludicola TaxID=360056 RepID=UPI00029A6542|nr:hypothetical protein [Schlesneria paludicola]